MLVELNNIHKWFGAVHANDGITMSIPPNSIQGILGENGAGKSTLMKILSGFIQADQGEILLDGKPVKINNPADGIQHGIGMLHQDPLDFPPMRIIDNFLIGKESGLFPRRKEALRDFNQLQQQFGFELNAEVYVDTLTVGERQQLEILRLLWLGAKVLILDEPTTGISAFQKEKLFDTLRKLVDQGMTVIFVSHKLEEVENLCHRIAAFRRGELVGEIQPPYYTDDLVKMMFGKAVSVGGRVDTCTSDPVMQLANLTIEDYRLQIRDVNLEICKGEVIGLAGMEGSGQRQFLRTLAGLIRPVEGRTRISGKDLTGRPYALFQQQGIAYVPAARLEEGLIPGLTFSEHVLLTEKSDGYLINRDKAEKAAKERIVDFSIHGTPASQMEELSGGNQQRALLALLRTPLKLLLLEHPTRGLDIESSIWIWSKLKERCRQGTSIVFISSDLDELLLYSDRILVFFAGRISAPLNADQTSVDQLGQLIGGKG